MNPAHRENTQDLLRAIDPSYRILLHPSSCSYFPGIESMAFDTVLLVSNGFYRSHKRGKAICLKEDNNFVTGHLHGRGIRLNALCVIRDGCCEGGNYECILGRSSLGRLIPLLPFGSVISKDHNRLRGNFPWKLKRIAIRDYQQEFAEHSAPIGRLSAFEICDYPRRERSTRLGNLEVVVSHQSIWENLHTHDLLFMAISEHHIHGYLYFVDGLVSAGIDRTKVLLHPHRPVLSIANVLAQAEEREHQRICLGPIADGNYSRILEEIASHRGRFLREIKFCYLDSSDLRSIP